MRRPVIVGLVLCALAADAGADQCQVVSQDTARWAVKLLTGGVVVKRCEPCEDKGGTPMPVKKVEAKRWSGDAKQSVVIVNGKETDLAYLFLQTGQDTYTNVALMAGCAAKDVSTFINLSAPPAAGGPLAKVGIKECDEFLVKYTACVDTKFPEASRKAARDSLKEVAEAWKQAATTPEGRQALANACGQMIEATKDATKAMGCQW
jgi:hypothetical protein